LLPSLQHLIEVQSISAFLPAFELDLRVRSRFPAPLQLSRVSVVLRRHRLRSSRIATGDGNENGPSGGAPDIADTDSEDGSDVDSQSLSFAGTSASGTTMLAATPSHTGHAMGSRTPTSHRTWRRPRRGARTPVTRQRKQHAAGRGIGASKQTTPMRPSRSDQHRSGSSFVYFSCVSSAPVSSLPTATAASTVAASASTVAVGPGESILRFVCSSDAGVSSSAVVRSKSRSGALALPSSVSAITTDTDYAAGGHPSPRGDSNSKPSAAGGRKYSYVLHDVVFAWGPLEWSLTDSISPDLIPSDLKAFTSRDLSSSAPGISLSVEPPARLLVLGQPQYLPAVLCSKHDTIATGEISATSVDGVTVVDCDISVTVAADESFVASVMQEPSWRPAAVADSKHAEHRGAVRVVTLQWRSGTH